LSISDVRVARVRRGGSSVRFAMRGEAAGVTVLLDRTPISVMDDEPAEVEFELEPTQVLRLAGGRLPLSRALLRGELTGRGPVRRYLEIDAILQSLLREQAGGDENTAGPASGGDDDPAAARELMAIETVGLKKSFGGQAVLDGTDLSIPEGMIGVVLGPSGTGKSVLLQHLIGLLKPDAGEVRIRGRALTGMSRSELMLLRREIGVMFQDGALFSGMNVFDNVAFPLREHSDMENDEIETVVLSRLRDVGLEGAANKLPAQLSGGMRKRAGLARALVLDPSIVLCDEPDSGLDPVRTAGLCDLLIEQHDGGGGVMLVVTHDISLAKRLADHISVLWQGRIVESGTAEHIFESKHPFVRQFLTGEVDGPLAME
jgi:phospholipid/cholesterol/gamma-HCH transport system ATP-binding protein